MADADALFDLIWERAARDPEKTIVIDAARRWTWRELLWRAEGWARAMRRLPGANPIVPVFPGRNGDSIAALLGCVLAGRAFAPLHAEQPRERLESCLNRLKATAMISTNDTRSGPLPLLANEPAEGPGLPPAPAPKAESLFYVLFTSGSTGAPKGVMVSHANIANTMAWGSEMLPWRADDVIGLAVNFYFDIAMFDVFAALCSGTPLAIFSKPGDLAHTADEISAFRISSIFSAPAFFSQLLRGNLMTDPRLNSLRRIVSGGDFFPPAHVLAWLDARPDIELYNVWGPTETSIVNTMHLVGPADLPALREGRYAPVGGAHARMPLVVVDDKLRLVKNGERGEICMLGTCVTRGYLEDEERTRAAYVEIDGQRAYRTQDLGFLDVSGELHVTGRMGSLTKVGGYRVDLAEVEGAATLLPGVHLACAFVREPQVGLQELWLAVEARTNGVKPDIFAWKTQLRTLLPAYMVPKRVVLFDELPLTPNRKLDRKAVQEMAA